LLNFLALSFSSTSGTEPKIKYYLEGKGQDPSVIGKVLGKVVEELRSSWMEAADNGLEEP
jgi:phosphomannomutase